MAGSPLLDDLYHAAHFAITAWLRLRTDCPIGQPGLVVAVQIFGDFLFWHPHVHIIATAGVFDADDIFHVALTGGWEERNVLETVEVTGIARVARLEPHVGFCRQAIDQGGRTIDGDYILCGQGRLVLLIRTS